MTSIEIRLNTDGFLDEIVGEGPVHLEQLRDDQWWLGVTDKQGRVTVLLTASGKITASYDDERKKP